MGILTLLFTIWFLTMVVGACICVTVAIFVLFPWMCYTLYQDYQEEKQMPWNCKH